MPSLRKATHGPRNRTSRNRTGSGIRRALARLAFAMAAVSIANISSLADSPRRGEPPIFEVAERLVSENTNDNWRDVLGLAAAIRDETLLRAERSPLEKSDKLADPGKLLKVPRASPGLHSLVHTSRYASELPPGPGSSYLHSAAVVIHGDLIAKIPPLLKTHRRSPGRSFDGYIAGCVLLVDGEIDTTSYIHDSIVIAKGPIRLGGYIYNSLVFSLGTNGASSIDVAGYLNHALVVAENVAVSGYTFESIIYGTLECSDLRGADLREPQAMLRLPWEIEAAASLGD